MVELLSLFSTKIIPQLLKKSNNRVRVVTSWILKKGKKVKKGVGVAFFYYGDFLGGRWVVAIFWG